MATLVGRECWHVGAVLAHGKIVEHLLHIPAVVILTPNGRITVHASQAKLTLREALEAVEDAADYWGRKLSELQKLRDGDGDV